MELKALISEIKRFLRSSYWLTPVNLKEQLDLFKADHTRDPLFEYPELPYQELKEYLAALNKAQLHAESDLETYYFNRKRTELELKLKLLLARGSEDFGTISLELFQCSFASPFLIQAEQDSLITESFAPREDLTAEEASNIIQDYLESYEISDWKVELTEDRDYYFRVKGNRRTIYIGKNLNWDFCDMDNVLAHEIDGHLLRAVNASFQVHPLLHKPFPFYIKTEEGLASYLGDKHTSSGKISLKHHALKYLAGIEASRSSFSAVYQFLKQRGFTDGIALQRTFRLKRGLTDTSIPGCYAKEAAYYEGMLEVRDFIDNNGDIRKLYSAKAGLQDLPYLPEATKVIMPKRLKINAAQVSPDRSGH